MFMKRMKKRILLCAALLAVGTLGGAAACNQETKNASVESSYSSSDDSLGSSSTSDSSSTKEEYDDYEPVYPTDDIEIVWKQPASGVGAEYPFEDRFACEEGYYELTLTKGKKLCYSFSVSEAGQYALYSIDGAAGVTVTRYDASAHYIPPTGEKAYKVEKGFYSYVHCSERHFNAEWRATYSIKANADKTIKVRFVRIGDPIPDPETIVTKMTAQEIKGKAPNAAKNQEATPVPWEANLADAPVEYFYDADYEITVTPFNGGEPITAKGFYRMGTQENPGALIWAAISTQPTRLFDKTFTTIQYEGNNLSLSVGKTENGDYLVNAYMDFIMSNGGEMAQDQDTGVLVPAAGDPNKPCYENAANDAGFYPVNQELFVFLNEYVSNNPPILDDGIVVESKNHWLGACYYYAEKEMGTKDSPYDLTEGENTITVNSLSSVYYLLSSAQAQSYTVTSTDSNLCIRYGGQNYGADGNGFSVTVEATAEGALIEFMTVDGNAGAFTVTLTKTVDE